MFVRWWRGEVSHHLSSGDPPLTPLQSFTVQLQLILLHIVAETKVIQEQLQVTEQSKTLNVEEEFLWGLTLILPGYILF